LIDSRIPEDDVNNEKEYSIGLRLRDHDDDLVFLSNLVIMDTMLRVLARLIIRHRTNAFWRMLTAIRDEYEEIYGRRPYHFRGDPRDI
jgi:hypothetical protein